GARLPRAAAALADLLDDLVAVHRLLGEEHQDGGSHVAATGTPAAAPSPAPSAMVAWTGPAVHAAPAAATVSMGAAMLMASRKCVAPSLAIHVVVVHVLIPLIQPVRCVVDSQRYIDNTSACG